MHSFHIYSTCNYTVSDLETRVMGHSRSSEPTCMIRHLWFPINVP